MTLFFTTDINSCRHDAAPIESKDQKFPLLWVDRSFRVEGKLCSDCSEDDFWNKVARKLGVHDPGWDPSHRTLVDLTYPLQCPCRYDVFLAVLSSDTRFLEISRKITRGSAEGNLPAKEEEIRGIYADP